MIILARDTVDVSLLYLPSVPAAELWSGPVPGELDPVPSISVLFQQPKLILHQQLAHTNRHIEGKWTYYICSQGLPSWNSNLFNTEKPGFSMTQFISHKVKPKLGECHKITSQDENNLEPIILWHIWVDPISTFLKDVREPS